MGWFGNSEGDDLKKRSKKQEVKEEDEPEEEEEQEEENDKRGNCRVKIFTTDFGESFDVNDLTSEEMKKLIIQLKESISNGSLIDLKEYRSSAIVNSKYISLLIYEEND